MCEVCVNNARTVSDLDINVYTNPEPPSSTAPTAPAVAADAAAARVASRLSLAHNLLR